jgi:hypothetical protein
VQEPRKINAFNLNKKLAKKLALLCVYVVSPYLSLSFFFCCYNFWCVFWSTLRSEEDYRDLLM